MKAKLFLISLVLLFFVRISYGQESIEIPLNNLSEEWTPFYEGNSIQLSFKESACTDPAGGRTIDRLLIQIQNKTGNRVLVNWHYDIYNTEGCITCDDPVDENLFRFILTPNQIISPDCNSFKVVDEELGHRETLGIYLKYSERTDVSDTQRIEISDFSTYVLD
jgi:hypothetical protein